MPRQNSGKKRAVIIAEKRKPHQMLSKERKSNFGTIGRTRPYQGERVRQLTIGFSCLNEVLSYGRTTSIKDGLGYEMKGKVI